MHRRRHPAAAATASSGGGAARSDLVTSWARPAREQRQRRRPSRPDAHRGEQGRSRAGCRRHGFAVGERHDLGLGFGSWPRLRCRSSLRLRPRLPRPTRHGSSCSHRDRPGACRDHCLRTCTPGRREPCGQRRDVEDRGCRALAVTPVEHREGCTADGPQGHRQAGHTPRHERAGQPVRARRPRRPLRLERP